MSWQGVCEKMNRNDVLMFIIGMIIVIIIGIMIEWHFIDVCLSCLNCTVI